MLKFTLLLFSILVFTSSCDLNSLSQFIPGQAEALKPVEKKSKKRLPVVYSSVVKEQTLTTETTVTGTLEANRHVNVFNQSEGMLIKLPFREGDRVKKGQIIARLDDTLIKIDNRKAIVVVEILSGLKLGDKIFSKGQYGLKDKMQVKVVKIQP